MMLLGLARQAAHKSRKYRNLTSSFGSTGSVQLGSACSQARQEAAQAASMSSRSLSHRPSAAQPGQSSASLSWQNGRHCTLPATKVPPAQCGCCSAEPFRPVGPCEESHVMQGASCSLSSSAPSAQASAKAPWAGTSEPGVSWPRLRSGEGGTVQVCSTCRGSQHCAGRTPPPGSMTDSCAPTRTPRSQTSCGTARALRAGCATDNPQGVAA